MSIQRLIEMRSKGLRPWTASVLGVALLAGSALQLGCGRGPFEGPTSLLLITVDTQRHDFLGAYGYPEDVSPFIDQLADRGVVFENAVTVAGTTFPAHASILTGLYPREHGALANGFRLAEGVPTVAEQLTAAGYRTGSFVSYRAMHKNGNLDRGFEAASDREWVRRAPPIRPGRVTFEMAREWLRSIPAESEAPIFLWVHLFEPHWPLPVTDWSTERLSGYDGFMREGLSVEAAIERKQEIFSSAVEQKAIRELYAGRVHEADELVGEIVEAFSDAVDGDFVGIVAADHGEALGDENRIGHGQVFWEEVVRVPILLWDERHPTPRRVRSRVSLIDISATLFDLAGLDVPSLRGRSLTSFQQDVETDDDRVLFVDTAADNPRRAAPKVRPETEDRSAVAVYSGRYKFERFRGVDRLYEQGEDLTFRLLEEAEIPRSIWGELSRRASEYTSEVGLAAPADLDEADLEALRSLGYLQ